MNSGRFNLYYEKKKVLLKQKKLMRIPLYFFFLKLFLGCRQAVRHGVLIPAYAGSNPATPVCGSQQFPQKCNIHQEVAWIRRAHLLKSGSGFFAHIGTLMAFMVNDKPYYKITDKALAYDLMIKVEGEIRNTTN